MWFVELDDFAPNVYVTAFLVKDPHLDSGQAKRIAIAAHDGFARALYPVHTPADGDLIFVASTGALSIDAEALLDLGVLAGNVTARAIARGVYEAMQDEHNSSTGKEKV